MRKKRKTQKALKSAPEEKSALPLLSPTPVWPYLLVGVGAVLIVVCAKGGLWFDEILSLQWVRNSKNPWDLLMLFRHDNNHLLNSIWMMLWGESASSFAYRGLSIFSGILALFLILHIARVISPATPWVPLLLSATSFPWILYASEARGYAPAIACSLAAFFILLKNPASHREFWIPAFWIVCALGMLSHGTVLYVIGALGLWKVVCEFSSGRAFRSIATSLLLWFGVPLLLTLAYYVYFLRPMMIAGGPEYSVPTVLGHFFGYALGLPIEGPLAGITFLVSLALIGAGIWSLKWDQLRLPVFFALILVMPAVALVLTGAQFLYFRYFLVCLPFLYLLSGSLAARAWQSGSRTLQFLTAAVLVFFVCAQIPRLSRLMAHDRGQYLRALEFIGTHPSGGKTISSDQDLLNGMVVEYYLRTSNNPASLSYVPRWAEAKVPAEWMILHSQSTASLSPSPVFTLAGASYQLETIFPAGPVSGTHWFLYRLKGPDAADNSHSTSP